MTRLTERQIEILRWIDTHPHDRSSRTFDDSLVLAGDRGSITIAWPDNQALMDCVEPNPDRGAWRAKHFALSKSGRSALARANKGGGDA